MTMFCAGELTEESKGLSVCRCLAFFSSQDFSRPIHFVYKNSHAYTIKGRDVACISLSLIEEGAQNMRNFAKAKTTNELPQTAYLTQTGFPPDISSSGMMVMKEAIIKFALPVFVSLL